MGQPLMVYPLRHIPDFAAVTDAERAERISARCAVCGQRLGQGAEFITSGCRGAATA